MSNKALLEELAKAVAALKQAVEDNNKEAQDKASKAVIDAQKRLQNATDRATEFPVEDENEMSFAALHKRVTDDPKIVEFQKRCDDVYLVSKLLNIDPRQTKLYKEMFEPVSELRKALTTATAGGGAEWIPTGFSADLIRRIEMALKVAALHGRIRMPTDPFKVPTLTGYSMARLGSENTAPAQDSGVTTGNITLDAKKLIVRIPLSYELEEDSIVPVLPLIKTDIVNALARAEENATINGDTAATHMDADVTAADDARKAWDGYRKLAPAASKVDAANANLTSALLRKVRAAMGVYGVDPMELAWVTSISGYNQFLNLSEVLTLDKYGPNATILTGELGKFDGIPIIVSEYVRADLNASGVYDGTTADRTIVLLVRRDGFVYGDRRLALVETFKDIETQSTKLVASRRLDFKARYPGQTAIGVLYNVKASL